MAVPVKEKAFDAGEFIIRLLKDAAGRGASDIYFLPRRGGLDVRIRLEGVQEEVASLAAEQGELCIGKLKVMAKLLTYRSRIAQDGAIRDAALFGECEFRAASMPVLHGERITLRILNNERRKSDLDELGLEPSAVASLRSLLDAPSGMIILTGPTGSGKTTTMYALARELLKRRDDPASIIGIEDPVECEIPGISQLDLAAAGSEMTLAGALKAALRQDVKTLLIGEIRDAESVRVALEAAFTGHRVIASFHAGDVPMVFARLLQMDFEPFMIAGAVSAVVAQRLVRRRGNPGRIPAAAVLHSDDSWRELILRSPSLQQLRAATAARPDGDLFQVLQRMAAAGTIEESEAWV